MENKLFKSVDPLRKKPAVAQIGGFRPDDEIKSWFGGRFLTESNDTWPILDGEKAIPIIQIAVAELPIVPDMLKGKQIIQIFLSQVGLPVDLPAKNGDKFLIRELSDTSLVEAYDAPSLNFPKTFQVRWNEGDLEGPVWEEVFYHADNELISEHMSSEDPFGSYNDRYFGVSTTKVGGWATYIQGLSSKPSDLMIQVSSETKSMFGIGDSGNIYFYLDDFGEWTMSWDCY